MCRPLSPRWTSRSPCLGSVRSRSTSPGAACGMHSLKRLPLGLGVANENGPRLVELDERVKRAVQARFTPVHPENPSIKGVSIIVITEPVEEGEDGKVARNTVVVSPGRFDRSPCGSGTCARMAVMHARGQLMVGEVFRHRSIIGTEFVNHIRGTAKVGDYDAILPTV